MFIGTLKVDLFIPTSNSLKYRRQVLKSIKEKIRRSFNVGVGEEPTDKWQRARIFIVGINGNKLHLERAFSNIEKMLGLFREIEVIDTEREFF